MLTLIMSLSIFPIAGAVQAASTVAAANHSHVLWAGRTRLAGGGNVSFDWQGVTGVRAEPAVPAASTGEQRGGARVWLCRAPRPAQREQALRDGAHLD